MCVCGGGGEGGGVTCFVLLFCFNLLFLFIIFNEFEWDIRENTLHCKANLITVTEKKCKQTEN